MSYSHVHLSNIFISVDESWTYNYTERSHRAMSPVISRPLDRPCRQFTSIFSRFGAIRAYGQHMGHADVALISGPHHETQ